MRGLRLMPGRALLLIPALISLGVSCRSGVEPAPGARPLLVAGFYPLAEAARQVGGERLEVYDLTPPGADAHDLELSPSDLQRIRQADLVLYLGGGFQPAVERAARDTRGLAVDLLEGLPLREPEEEGEDPHGAEEDGDEHGHPQDPHVWLDPLLLARMVDRISEELSRLTPQEASGYRARAGAYRAQLVALHAEFQRGLAGCRQRQLVTGHAAFGYLADRYGLEQVAVSGLSPEAEPPPRTVARIVQLVQERGVRAVYTEPGAPARVAALVAREAGADLRILYPLESLTPEQQARGEGYLEVMRSNLTALREGLECP